MSTQSDPFAALTASLAADIEATVIAVFKGKWDTLPQEYKDAVKRAAARYAKLTLLEKAGYDVADHVSILEATLANWKAAAQIELYDAFMESATKIVTLLGNFAGKAARSFIGI